MVLRVTSDCVCESRLTRAVGAHDGVDLALLDLKVYTVEDSLCPLLGFDTHVQVFD